MLYLSALTLESAVGPRPRAGLPGTLADAAAGFAADAATAGAVLEAGLPSVLAAGDVALADDMAAVTDCPAAVPDGTAVVADDVAAVADGIAAVADGIAAMADGVAEVADCPAAVADDAAVGKADSHWMQVPAAGTTQQSSAAFDTTLKSPVFLLPEHLCSVLDAALCLELAGVGLTAAFLVSAVFFSTRQTPCVLLQLLPLSPLSVSATTVSPPGDSRPGW